MVSTMVVALCCHSSLARRAPQEATAAVAAETLRTVSMSVLSNAWLCCELRWQTGCSLYLAAMSCAVFRGRLGSLEQHRWQALLGQELLKLAMLVACQRWLSS